MIPCSFVEAGCAALSQRRVGPTANKEAASCQETPGAEGDRVSRLFLLCSECPHGKRKMSSGVFQLQNLGSRVSSACLSFNFPSLETTYFP